MADILKFMHCGCEYTFSSTKEPPFPEDIFGDGSDGDCHITYNVETAGHVTIPAQEYNFCNLCIDENVTLHFCGEGIPVLRVKENFINNGTIQLRNPLLCCNYEEYIQGLKEVIHSKCNYCYELACAYYNCECFTLEGLSQRAAPGGAGCSGRSCDGGAGGIAGGSGCDGCQGGAGGTSAYANAGGGGGSGKHYGCNYGTGCPGCPAPADGIGGDGGNSYNYITCSSYYGTGGGGGGGYGYCKGGDGGYSCGAGCTPGASGGAGGNSYIGDGGNGGASYSYRADAIAGKGGKGGDSRYGNGGKGGYAVNCEPGSGGCSIYGNGGDGGEGSPGCFSCCKTHKGGDSLFGIGGCGVTGGNGLDGGCSVSSSSCGSSGIAWGGVYGLGLFANNIENNGTIYGRGGDTGYSFRCTCNHKGTDGAEIYIVVGCEYCNAGEISCRAGIGGCYSGGKMPDGEAGFVKFYHM